MTAIDVDDTDSVTTTAGEKGRLSKPADTVVGCLEVARSFLHDAWLHADTEMVTEFTKRADKDFLLVPSRIMNMAAPICIHCCSMNYLKHLRFQQS